MAGEIPKYKIGVPVAHRTLSFYAKPKPEADVFAEGLSQHIAKAVAEGLAKHGVEVERFKKKPAAAAPPGPAVDKRAIWVVHGMGQQVPFETVDALAQGVIGALKKGANGWSFPGPPRVVSTKFSSPDDPTKINVVQRVELPLEQTPSGQPTQHLELHLYEAYWAPVTEGVAKLTDVMSFLYDGALHGLLNCTRPFQRAMFPEDSSRATSPEGKKEGKKDQGIWDFRIRKRTAAEIILLLLLVFALGAINAVIVAASAAKLKFPMFGGWPVASNWDQLTALATAVTALALTFGAVLYLAVMSERVEAPVFLKRAVSVLGWATLIVTALAILAAGGLMSLISWNQCVALWFRHIVHYRATQFVSTIAILLAALLCLSASLQGAVKKSRGESHRKGKFPLFLFFAGCALHPILFGLLLLVNACPDVDSWFAGRAADSYALGLTVAFFAWSAWVWPSLLYVSHQLANIIVEYAGDVAIYVTPNKLDRFNDARQKIKQLALESLMPLYAARADGSNAELYSKIALVGHSLGSVIAYDTLNKLLTLDDLLDPVHPPFGVANRTSILETFGSPLDKTAFFFSYQGQESFDIREQLAACVQPLIQNYEKYRKFPWVNVYSFNDIISGRLRFYDVVPPATNPPNTFKVQPVKDPDAFVPLIAHVEYWTNETLWNILVNRITQ